ncbi:hypothetical protein ACQ4PT_043370 [Festuca glaucescens]
MASTSWLRCLVLDYGDDEQRAMLQLTPTTTRTAKRARSNISHDAASTTTTTTTLPDDTLVEIFSRLPSRSIGRFLCLSRSWAATLTSAPFVDLHFHQANDHRLMPKLFSTTVDHLDDDPDEKWHVKVLTKPCRGLVLLRRKAHSGYYVCNPSTGQLLRLPKGCGRCLCVSYGLGYSPATMEYKVARLFASCNSPLRCEVLTLDVSVDARWRAVAQKPPSGAVRSPAVFFDGYLHFLVRQRGANGLVDSITTFDIVDEILGSLTVPPAAQGNVFELTLTVLNGFLCLCVHRPRSGDVDDDPDCCIWIWRLACRREAGRWEMLYRVLQPQTTTNPELDLWRLRRVSPLEIYRAGNGQKKDYVRHRQTCAGV